MQLIIPHERYRTVPDERYRLKENVYVKGL